MRKSDRLDYYYDEKCRLHKKYLSDWRSTGQLDSNFYGWLMEKYKVDLFFFKEDKMLRYLREYIKELVGSRFED